MFVFFHCCILLSFNPFRLVLKWIFKCDSSFVFHNELRKIAMLSWEDSFSEFLNLVRLDVLVLVSVKTNIQHWEMIMMIYIRIMVSNWFFILELFSNKWLWSSCAEIQTRPLENILKEGRLYFITYYYVTFLDATPTTNQ